ncbi:hypothetical protein HMPREF9628_00172 [Peptoanaerobacter stomatis]|uniref:Uncharacterized protein n=1 Tax=Peptoanaerobacter stomatis TaxID=796937 RepID=G9XBW4_9FIRM|nr:hypothetical protein [Peptoanaerobacter stomatis]EHL19451.1 hypothetical protein HMPREF9628_00172 [Peptoanaerobacter stomatis]
MNMLVKSNDVFVEIKYDELKQLITKATQRDILLELLKDDKKYQGIKNALDGAGNSKKEQIKK